MLRVVIASDSFKGSLTSAEVARSIVSGIRSVIPDCECIELSIADGGEGTVDALMAALGGSRVNCRVHDPLMREIRASYAVLGDGHTAVIDTASASGLALLSNGERNPLKTSTFGTGEMIMDALHRGCSHFLVGLGGSATNDGGMGLFSALGYRFLDNAGRTLPGCGESLVNVADIDFSAVHPGLEAASFTVACDVDTPFCGPDGAAYVFSPQKGAGAEDVAMLDRGLANFADVIHQCLGRDIVNVPGSGAAGGLGGGFLAFSNAVLKSGIDMVLDAIGFDSIIDGADLVITGEGRIDSQTFRGKAPYGVMLRARARRIPVYAIGGCLSLDGVEGVSTFPLVAGVDGIGGIPVAFSGLGFDCIVPCVSGDYDPDYVLRPDVAGRNVASAARLIASVLLKM